MTSVAVFTSVCAPTLLYLLLYGADFKVSGLPKAHGSGLSRCVRDFMDGTSWRLALELELNTY